MAVLLPPRVLARQKIRSKLIGAEHANLKFITLNSEYLGNPSFYLAYVLGPLGVEVSQTIVEEGIIGLLERNRTFLCSFYRKYFENQEKLINEIAHKNYKGNSTNVYYLFCH